MCSLQNPAAVRTCSRGLKPQKPGLLEKHERRLGRRAKSAPPGVLARMLLECFLDTEVTLQIFSFYNAAL